MYDLYGCFYSRVPECIFVHLSNCIFGSNLVKTVLALYSVFELGKWDYSV